MWPPLITACLKKTPRSKAAATTNSASGWASRWRPLLGLLGIWLGHFEALGAKGGLALGLLPAAALSLWMLKPLLGMRKIPNPTH